MKKSLMLIVVGLAILAGSMLLVGDATAARYYCGPVWCAPVVYCAPPVVCVPRPPVWCGPVVTVRYPYCPVPRRVKVWGCW
jgi:hypothetical protein